MNLDNLRRQFLDELPNIKNLDQLEELRVNFIGRKSKLIQFLRSLKDLSIEERKETGPIANKLRNEIEETIKIKSKELSQKNNSGRSVDVTMPGKKTSYGKLHPLTILEKEIRKIFLSLNFSVVEGPEVETEYYNFDALNIADNHPAKDIQDTFWVDINKKQIFDLKIKNLNKKPTDKLLMRTQTSSMQIRYMEKHQPPLQIIVPGRVFRNEATDASHEINFYQVEGLMVGKDVSLVNFRFVVTEFFKKFFRKSIEIRFRPSYFPFVEPGLEVDIKMDDKWLEVMGAGMVHQKVFKNVGYTPGEWQGFAFGVGLDRLAMIKYNIPDIRLFYSGDLRFIHQF